MIFHSLNVYFVYLRISLKIDKKMLMQCNYFQPMENVFWFARESAADFLNYNSMPLKYKKKTYQ